MFAQHSLFFSTCPVSTERFSRDCKFMVPSKFRSVLVVTLLFTGGLVIVSCLVVYTLFLYIVHLLSIFHA